VFAVNALPQAGTPETSMFKRTCLVVLTLSSLLATSACTDTKEAQRIAELTARRTALISQLQDVDAARVQANHVLVEQAQRVESLSEEAAQVQAKAAQHKRAINAFMMDHKMAVAAIAVGAAGGTVALDDSGRFTQEARDIGTVVGFVAIGWALFNTEEVAHVASELVKAEAAQQALGSRADALAHSLAAQRQGLAQAEAGLVRFSQQAVSIRTALQTL
jgi:hypothetical protein